MSKFSLKFTTLKEWKPDLLDENDNPNNPVCLILDDSCNTKAFFIPHVNKDCYATYLFSCEDEDKTFTNLQEAAEYVGINSNSDEEENFLKSVHMFVLSEQAKFERESKYYDGLHTPYNDELKRFKLIEYLSNYNYSQDLIVEDSTMRPGDIDTVTRVVLKFIQNRFDGKVAMQFFNNWNINSIKDKTIKEFCIRNAQVDYIVSQFAACLYNSMDKLEDIIDNKTFEEIYIPYIKKNLDSVSIEHRGVQTLAEFTILKKFNNLENKTIRFYVKSIKDDENVTAEEIDMNNVELGIHIKDKKTGLIDNFFEGHNTHYLVEKKLRNNLDPKETPMFDSAKPDQNSDKDNISLIKDLNNGYVVRITPAGSNYSLLISKDGKVLNRYDADLNNNYEHNIPPLTMHLLKSSVENILQNLSKDERNLTSSDNTFYNADDLENLNFNDKNIAIQRFDNDYGIKILKTGNGTFTVDRFIKGFEDVSDDYKEGLTTKELLNYINSTMRLIKNKNIYSTLTKDVYSKDLEFSEIKDKLTNSFALKITFTNKFPHDVAVIVKRVSIGEEDGNKEPGYDLKISEIGGTSENKEHTSFDKSVTELDKDTPYSNVYDFLEKNGIEFPLRKENDGVEKNLMKCINFIKDNSIGTSDDKFKKLIETNPECAIKFYYPHDTDITHNDIKEILPILEKNPIYYCFVQTTSDGHIKADSENVSVIKVCLEEKRNEKIGNLYSTQYYSYSHTDKGGNEPYKLHVLRTSNPKHSEKKIRTESDLIAKLNETKRYIKK